MHLLLKKVSAVIEVNELPGSSNHSAPPPTGITRTCASRAHSTKGDIYEGRLGRTGNTAPSSSDVITTGSKRFALQGIEYAFL
jgi:hypothetical protein